MLCVIFSRRGPRNTLNKNVPQHWREDSHTEACDERRPTQKATDDSTPKISEHRWPPYTCCLCRGNSNRGSLSGLHIAIRIGPQQLQAIATNKQRHRHSKRRQSCHATHETFFGPLHSIDYLGMQYVFRQCC